MKIEPHEPVDVTVHVKPTGAIRVRGRTMREVDRWVSKGRGVNYEEDGELIVFIPLSSIKRLEIKRAEQT